MGRRLYQEDLKAIACLSMLLDHIGAVFVPGYYSYYLLRMVGRIAFPIYCFLLVEGAHHTRNPRRYALRLALGAAISEIPFDLTFFGGVTLAHQNVMFTLLLGLLAVEAENKLPQWARFPAMAALVLAAEWMQTDYGGGGVVLIVSFALAKSQDWKPWVMAPVLLAVTLAMGSASVPFLWGIPIELFATLALIPIGCYNGEKRGTGRGVQWLFYGFYPAHLLVLWTIKWLL